MLAPLPGHIQGHVQDLAVDVRIGAVAPAFDDEADPTEGTTEPCQAAADIDSLFEGDLDSKEFLSIASPKKKGRGGRGGRGGGRGRGGVPLGPAAAEEAQIEVLVGEVMAMEGVGDD